MAKSSTSFVAYSARNPDLAQLIASALRHVNSLPIPVQFIPWEFNDISGTPIVSPILSKIEDSAFVVADITYLNLNVVYEVGFAIGRRKRVFLIRHKNTEGDKVMANSVGIFDTLGYFEFENAAELSDRLAATIDPTPLPHAATLDKLAPVYIVEPPVRGEAATIMISRVKKTGFKYRSFNPAEDTRMSATDAIRQVSSSSGIVGMLQDGAVREADIHGVRTMFVTGLADGMLKPRLVLVPVGYDAPLDVRDTVSPVRDPGDIAAAVAEFCPRVVDHLTQSDPTANDGSSLLSSLSIGDPMAENEMSTLERYYLKTDQYQRALRGEVNLVVGRKGSGKTALFVSLRDRIRPDKSNIVVDLKPEGYQLLKLKEEILIYLTEGARQHLITAFWEYLILLEVAYKILEKDQHTHRFNHEIHDLYQDLSRIYRIEHFSHEGDFSERLLNLSQRLAREYKSRFGVTTDQRLTAQNVTELIYSHDIKELRERLSKYLGKKNSVWILFDNLDKGWSTTGVDAIDAVVLRCLIDAGRKIEREMQRAGHEFHCVVFVRNDVYDHLVQSSADHGKEMRAVLDWTDPDQLREMMRLRLVSGLEGPGANISFLQVWPKVSTPHYRGEETSQYFLERCLMRPRLFLRIFNHCRGFASNFNRQRIEAADIEKGLKSYSQDLLLELDREFNDIFPAGVSLLYNFIDTPGKLGDTELKVLLLESDIDESKFEEVIDFLLYYGVLGVCGDIEDHYIYTVNYDLKMLKMRANRAGEAVRYIVNPAFWPALGIRDELSANDHPALDFGQGAGFAEASEGGVQHP